MNHKSLVTMYEEDEEFREYVDRFATSLCLSTDEALLHRIVEVQALCILKSREDKLKK